MFRFRALLITLMLVLVFVTPIFALAQDTTPVEPSDPPDPGVIETWFLMAASVVGFVEVLKQTTLKPIRDALAKSFDEETTTTIYQVFIWALSFALAYVAVVNIGNGKTLFDALGFKIDSLLLAQVLSATAITFGESFLHNLYDFVTLRAGLGLLTTIEAETVVSHD